MQVCHTSVTPRRQPALSATCLVAAASGESLILFARVLILSIWWFMS